MPTPDTLIALRHHLHRHPETAGEEVETAGVLRSYLRDHLPEFEITSDIGGHGLLAVRRFGPGKTVALRAELDALNIAEAAHDGPRSEIEGKAHLCGHDGHMAMILDAGRKIEASKPEGGTLILIFQPAEETGEGAAAMLEDGLTERVSPDVLFALHNIPGRPTGKVFGRDGTFAYGSVGLQVEFAGKSAHAAHPENAKNPLLPAAELMKELMSEASSNREHHALATPVGLTSTGGALGTSPAHARLMMTLRADSSEALKALMERAEKAAGEISRTTGVDTRCEFVEYFPVTENPAMTEDLREACFKAGVEFEEMGEPFRWSEDFGHYGRHFPAYMFGIGSGEDNAALHAPDYVFPDALIDAGSSVFLELFKIHTST